MQISHDDLAIQALVCSAWSISEQSGLALSASVLHMQTSENLTDLSVKF
jgi:hypothetical protein